MTSTVTPTPSTNSASTSSDLNSGGLIFVWVSFAVGGAIIIVILTLIIVLVVRHKRDRCRKLSMIKLSVVNGTTGPSKLTDRRLTGAMTSPLGYFQRVTDDVDEPDGRNDDIWVVTHSSTSSSPTITSSGGTTASLGPRPPPPEPEEFGDCAGYDVEHRGSVHRSSPLAALNAIYAGIEMERANGRRTTNVDRRAGGGDRGGVVNNGFAATDDDQRLGREISRRSWRARLQAGIAGSTDGSCPRRDLSRSSSSRRSDRRASYLSDVIDSVRFFSGSEESGSDKSGSRPNSVRRPRPDPDRCAADGTPVPVAPSRECAPNDARVYGGGEWCLRPGSTNSNRILADVAHRPPEVERSSSSGLSGDNTYYTYAKQQAEPPGGRLPKYHHAVHSQYSADIHF